jgi:tubulin--tyrosine ligase-like protein 12
MPLELVETLYNKLQKGIYDAGEYLQIDDNEEVETFEVKAKEEIKKNSHLFLVDHALTFKYNDLRKALKQNPQLITRIKAMLKYSG